MAARRVTIKDVAKQAGVSVATASDAMNGKGRVSARTRENVLAVAAILGYSPSIAARNLIAGRTGTIALAISDGAAPGEFEPAWDIEYFLRVLSGASARAFDRGYLISMVPFHSSAKHYLISADGLIVVDPVESDPLLSEESLARVEHCVTVGRNTKALSWVDNDFYAGTTSALHHLNAAGNNRIALFLSGTNAPYVQDELSAYLDWCGTQQQDPIIIQSPGPTIDDAEPAILAALQDPSLTFDSVAATLETLALAVERSAFALGLRIPQDLQILSLTDSRYLAAGVPASISALDLHPLELGEMAVDIIIDQIEGRDFAKTHVCPTTLRVRNSTLEAAN